MNFFLTSYIYPIKQPIKLSKNLGILLDNAKGEEIDELENYLTLSHEGFPSSSVPPEADDEYMSLRSIYNSFVNNYSPHEAYISEFYNKTHDQNIYRVISQSWVIARFDNQGRYEELKQSFKKLKEEGRISTFILNEDDPLIMAEERTFSYFSLLSLLSHTEKNEYYGRQILADDKYSNYERTTPNREIFSKHYTMFMISASSEDWDTTEDSLRWHIYPRVLKDLTIAANLIEKALEDHRAESILYIGSILNMVGHQAKDDRSAIVFLTGIIEFILTHNPDFNRFNVEDSISRQFNLKMLVLLQITGETDNLQVHKNRLKQIYRLRSCIAHGELSAIKGILKKYGVDHLSSVVSDLYWYVRIAIFQWLEKPEFIDILKKG